MPYPAPVTGTTFVAISGWASSLAGPYLNGVGGVRYLFLMREAGAFPNVVRTLTAWKSTDSGETWAIVDNLNSPVIGADKSGETCYNSFPDPSSNVIWLSFPDTAGLINAGLAPAWRANFAFQPFDMDTDTWGAKVGGGPTMYAQIGNSSDGDVFQNTLFVYANGDVRAFVQGPPETIVATKYDRCYTALYSGGAWGASTVAFEAGEVRDFSPLNAVLGDAARVHVFAIGSLLTGAFGSANFGDRRLYHKTVTAGVLGALQLITTDIIPSPANGGTQFVSSVVTADNGGSTELLIGYIRPATLLPNSYTGYPAIARAISAAAPVWTLEHVDSTLAFASTSQFAGVPVLVSGSEIAVAWSGLDNLGSGASYVYYSTYSGGAWGAATLLYTDPTGDIGSDELNGRGLNSWGVIFADNGPADGEIDYFELASGPSIDCDSPPPTNVGEAYSHAFPASGGTPPYTFSITAGALPPGLTLDAATGIVSGVATTSGVYQFTITVTDSADASGEADCFIQSRKICLLVDLTS